MIGLYFIHDFPVENKMCLGNEREEVKHSTIGKGGSQVARGDTVNDTMLKD